VRRSSVNYGAAALDRLGATGDTERGATQRELPARFTPLQTASVSRRVLVFVVGPLLWLGAIIVVGVVVDRDGVVEASLLVTLIAFVLGLALSVIARRRRLREEREAEQS
jgi:hypothetical protein